MRLIAIDPGPELSAFIVYDTEGSWDEYGKIPNYVLLPRLMGGYFNRADLLCIEMTESRGMSVGKSVHETTYWIGRFVQAWFPEPFRRVHRGEVKLHICGSMRAKDGNIRQALIDRFGPPWLGTGKGRETGPTNGITADVWQSLALAVMCGDTQDK